MAKEKVLPLSHKLYFDAAYTALARAIRYDTLPCDDLRAKLAGAILEFGMEKLDEAARELLDYMPEGKKLVAMLKPEARKFCRQLLGPFPEEADAFFRNADGSRPENTPPELLRPTKKPEPVNEELTKEEVTPAKALVEPPPVLTSEQVWLQSAPLPQITERLHEVRQSLQENGPKSCLGKRAKDEIAYLEAEFGRRGLKIPKTPKPVARKRGA
jgi:hypothetical protein